MTTLPFYLFQSVAGVFRFFFVLIGAYVGGGTAALALYKMANVAPPYATTDLISIGVVFSGVVAGAAINYAADWEHVPFWLLTECGAVALLIGVFAVQQGSLALIQRLVKATKTPL
jgi:hypothetical protein